MASMTMDRLPFLRLHAEASLEVLRVAMVLGCAAALALAGVSFQV